MSIPPSFNRLLSTIGKHMPLMVEGRLRGLLVISGGSPPVMASLAARAILYHERVRHRYDKRRDYAGLYIYHDEFPEAKSLREVFERAVGGALYTEFEYEVYEKSERFLGRTFSYLVMDLTKDLKPNDVGKLVGVAEGGGLVLFLVPPWDSWDSLRTLFKENLTVPQFPEPRHVFITWFKRKLLEHEGVAIYDADKREVLKKFSIRAEERRAAKRQKPEAPDDALFPRELYELALTRDQVEVLKLMEGLYEKPERGKKKVLVVTADRGRGKSCAVAIGSVGLVYLLRKVKPKPRVLVTAPSPGSVQSFFEMSLKALQVLGLKHEVRKREGEIIEVGGRRFSIEYWSPLDVAKIKADLVVVDEAAGIHVPMLHKIWEAHRRIVYATTIHGYEGAGRGFSVRFMKRIRADARTELYEYEMEEPIRYGKDDPVEEWLFKTLLLDAEPAKLDEEDYEEIRRGELVYVKYDPQELFTKEKEDELRQLFGIYVLAHYRNEPDDLGMLADAPHHSIRAVKTKSGKIVCAIQLAEEGPIPRDMVDVLLRGGKIPGNIIPDRLLKHTRLKEFSGLRGWRIVRIATHPDAQGRGVGSWALKKLEEEARERGLDWIAAGFGVSEELLRFWVKNGFSPLHISPDRNPVSGEYTVLVVKPLKEEVERLVAVSEREFKQKLLLSLPINYRDMEPEVAHLLLESTAPLSESIDRSALTPIQLDRLWTYCLGPMTFEAAADLMFKLASLYFSSSRGGRPALSKDEEMMLIVKALEGASWEDAEERLGIPSKELIKKAHDIACKFFEYFAGKKADEYSPGVDLESLRLQPTPGQPPRRQAQAPS